MYRDEEIELLSFPEPHIIYLYDHDEIPDTTNIILDFGMQGIFEYQIPIFKLLEHDLEEINRRKMIILVPFMILKLRKSIEKERNAENTLALQALILNDIIGLIKKNQDLGNITAADARRLHDLIHKLYNHLYSHYEEFIEGGLNDMMEDGLILETDIIEAELTKKITKQVTEDVTRQVTEDVTRQVTQQVQENIICKLYSKLGDIDHVADLLGLSASEVEKTVGVAGK